VHDLLVVTASDVRVAEKIEHASGCRSKAGTPKTPRSTRPDRVFAGRVHLFNFSVSRENERGAPGGGQSNVDRNATLAKKNGSEIALVRRCSPLGIASAGNAEFVKATVQELLRAREPEFRTMPFRRFGRGAYESIDRVQAWRYARELIYIGTERPFGFSIDEQS
jgi:hypothetical protein